MEDAGASRAPAEASPLPPPPLPPPSLPTSSCTPPSADMTFRRRKEDDEDDDDEDDEDDEEDEEEEDSEESDEDMDEEEILEAQERRRNALAGGTEEGEEWQRQQRRRLDAVAQAVAVHQQGGAAAAAAGSSPLSQAGASVTPSMGMGMAHHHQQHHHHHHEAEERAIVSLDCAASLRRGRWGANPDLGGPWSDAALGALIEAFRQRRVASKWRNFGLEELELVAQFVNDRCGLVDPSEVKNGKQCRYKMYSLKRKYRREKEMMKLRGTASKWKWFSKMNEFFAADPQYVRLNMLCREDQQQLPQSSVSVSRDARANGGGGFYRSPPPARESFGGIEPNGFINGSSRDMEDDHHRSIPAGRLEVAPPQQHYEMGDEGSPALSKLEKFSRKLARKKHWAMAPCSPMEAGTPPSLNDSMRILIGQQREIVQLIREMVAIEDNKTHEAGFLGNSSLSKVLDIRRAIDAAEQNLIPLKQLCDQKERELKDAKMAYNEKSKLKTDLVCRLCEIMADENRLRLKRGI